MIELRQFLLWIVRKMAKWPMSCYNLLLDTFGYSGWYFPITGDRKSTRLNSSH